MSTLKATLLRAGMIIKHDGDLCTVYSVDHRTPGNKRAAMATKMRNLRTGSMLDYRFRAEEFIERVIVDEVAFEYLYSDGEGHHFIDQFFSLAVDAHLVEKITDLAAGPQIFNEILIFGSPFREVEFVGELAFFLADGAGQFDFCLAFAVVTAQDHQL